MADEKQPILTQEQHEQLLTAAVEKASKEATTKVDQELVTANEALAKAKADLEARDTKITELEKVNTDREETERLAKLASERVEKIKEVATFTDDQIKTRQDTWAKMSEEDFTAYLEDIRAVAKAPAKKESTTEFDGTRETAGARNGELEVVKSFFQSALADAEI